MLKEIIDGDKPASLEYVKEFEAQWNLKLPKSYRDFLLEHNGGRPVPSGFPIVGMKNNPEGSIQMFFGLHAKPQSCDLNWNLESLGVPQPDGLLPIACTGGGDFICISTKENNRVLFWDRHACWGKGKWKPKDFYPVASDFKNLLAKLYEIVPENESEIERILRTDDINALVRILDSGYPIESVDEYQRTLIERAAILGRPAMIRLLFGRGAKKRKALKYAEQNLEFFPEHKATVEVLRGLKSRTSN